jgi:ATP-dependent 26S proteasome regulatory subunit
MSQPKQKTIEALFKSLTDPKLPLPVCAHVLQEKLSIGDAEAGALLTMLLDASRSGQSEAKYQEALNKLNAKLEELEAGALRSGHFLGLISGVGSSVRGRVVLQDGQVATPCIPNEELAQLLEPGDRVLLDAQVKAILALDQGADEVGDLVQFQRAIDGQRAEVKFRDFEQRVVHVTAKLARQIRANEVTPGMNLLACARQNVAFEAVPNQEGQSRYRFLERDPIPDVLIDRDVASPPAVLAEALAHVRREMTSPELGHKYRLHRAWPRLLVGPTGTGKTLCLLALIRAVYGLISELTDVPLDQLPHRVLRLRPAQFLSKWLGESDRALDRFHDEIDELSAETLIGPDGREHRLPVIAIIEEVDGVARARSGEGEDVYHRIITTLLQRLDMNWRHLADQLVLFFFTSNVPHVIDPAFLRRAGGKIVQFDRLDRQAFASVLHKQLRDRPILASGEETGRRNGNAKSHAQFTLDDPAARLASAVTDALYSPNGQHDPGQVELSFAGSAAPVVKHLRDFLSGAVVGQAVQNASSRACQREIEEKREGGLTGELILDEISALVAGIVHQLTPQNAAFYLSLPEGDRVVRVRRLGQPTLSASSFERQL